MQQEFGEHEIITGDDCEDGGIADERFASPDAFGNTINEDLLNGRKSLEGQ